ncbi:hypothetical protein FDP41_005516 [Naegleria fowleri]|uniref:GST C-terminal domain-containing protein n=1 Tax=Naegleria fowleri TaxID=5763 RepID=A0A6A5BKY9_NAEFO|nr:uncharacterized protein FDP41_005683 [Naegleria fowleri]XP_044560235.1 uncharacterized protein FDP41_005516 [Naegleria fowleri]KAF0975312.1 hypothetical protein FDP41_005683 [Naegleria fowleri]KAF0975522.1 hypothetical protein FDP41_005516 [Naegleria fowleri]
MSSFNKKQQTTTKLTETPIKLLISFQMVFEIVYFDSPEELKERRRNSIVQGRGSLRTIFGALNKVLEANGGYLTGKLNWADLFFFEVELIIEKKLSIDVESVAPELKKLREHVMANEKAKTYLESERNLKRHS